MDNEMLRIAGQVGGIGGLSLGMFFLLFKEMIRKNIFPSLLKSHAYYLLTLFAVLTWSIGVLCIVIWMYIHQNNSIPEKINNK